MPSAKQQHEEQAETGDNQAVLEIGEEIALLHDGFIADQIEMLGPWQGQRISENRLAGFEAVDDHHEHREQGDQRIGDQNGMGGNRAPRGHAGLCHQN